MRTFLILLCILLVLGGCGTSDQAQQPIDTPTPSPTVTAVPTPTPTSSLIRPATIIQAVETFMADFDYECQNLVQVGETYMTPDSMLAVLRGTYLHGCIVAEQLHLAQLDFKDGGYQVINLYPGEEQATGFHPNVVNINGETIIWATLTDLQSQELRVYYDSGAYETVPIDGDSAIFRFKRGVKVTKLALLNANGEEISSMTVQGDALLPLANITHSIGAQIHPMTGEVLGVSGYPEVPDESSKTALTDAIQNAGLLQSRSDFTLISAKEYSERLYACISYSRNTQTVYELIIAELTLEGEIDILGFCEFAPPDAEGFKMYSTAIENDIICWTLLNETRSDGTNAVLMDFNSFAFHWDNGDRQEDAVVDRFFIYTNRHVPLPSGCTPIVNGQELSALSSNITRAEFHPIQ